MGLRVLAIQIDIIEFIPLRLQELADFRRLRCLSQDCAELGIFGTLATLAMHIAETHQLLEDGPDDMDVDGVGRSLSCFVCGLTFKSYATGSSLLLLQWLMSLVQAQHPQEALQ